MSLTPATIRTDLKCGNSAIPDDKQCHKGNATSVVKTSEIKSRKRKSSIIPSGFGKALVRGGAALAVGGGAAWAAGLGNEIATHMQKKEGKNPYFNIAKERFNTLNARQIRTIAGAVGGVGISLAGAGLAVEGIRTKNRALRAAGTQVALGGALGAGISATNAVETARAKKEIVNEAKDFRRKMGKARKQVRDFKNWTKAYAEEFRRRAQEARRTRSRAYNSNVHNAYSDLGVSPNASLAEIKRAWRAKARAHHPDVGGDPEQSKKYNAAYDEILRLRGIRDTAGDVSTPWAYGFEP